MEIIPTKTNIDFLGKAPIAFLFSGLLLAASMYLWFSKGAEKYGIDYAGGHEIILSVGEGSSTGDIRAALKKGGISSAIVQSFEIGSNEYSIRLPAEVASDDGDESVSTEATKSGITEALKDNLGTTFEITATEYVGPTIGDELKAKAVTAIVVGLIGMLAYITYRFEFSFALGAVVALFHDVVITLGVYLIAGKVLSMATLAACLTIVGYSVNDTIIVFDRMREEFFRQRSASIHELMNYSINATLSRTLITSVLTFFSAIALLLFGGGAIADLSLCLVVGVVAGTYSTIFIASPVALAWERFRASDEERLAQIREKQEQKEKAREKDDATADGVRL